METQEKVVVIAKDTSDEDLIVLPQAESSTSGVKTVSRPRRGAQVRERAPPKEVPISQKKIPSPNKNVIQRVPVLTGKCVVSIGATIMFETIFPDKTKTCRGTSWMCSTNCVEFSSTQTVYRRWSTPRREWNFHPSIISGFGGPNSKQSEETGAGKTGRSYPSGDTADEGGSR